MDRIQMISPPVFILSKDGANTKAHSVFGWWVDDDRGAFQPIVANPDGSGIGPWSLFYGTDPWTVS